MSVAPRWRWWIHLVLIGIYPFLGMILRSRQIPRVPSLASDARGLLIVCGLEITLFSLVFALGWLASRASREELLFRWRPGWWVVPLGVVYSVAIRLAVLAVVMVVVLILLSTRASTPEAITEFVGVNRPNVEAVVNVSALQNNPSYFWLTLTLVSFVVAGLREEMWRAGTLAALRALWPRAFATQRGQWIAVTLIAALFGAMHLGMGSIAAVLAGVTGWFLGLIMVYHRSIWPAVIAHGVFDATTFAFLAWALGRLQHGS
jgi:membrane protease YdiL (CAAX protease family)